VHCSRGKHQIKGRLGAVCTRAFHAALAQGGRVVLPLSAAIPGLHVLPCMSQQAFPAPSPARRAARSVLRPGSCSPRCVPCPASPGRCAPLQHTHQEATGVRKLGKHSSIMGAVCRGRVPRHLAGTVMPVCGATGELGRLLPKLGCCGTAISMTRCGLSHVARCFCMAGGVSTLVLEPDTHSARVRLGT
jgi:hypothetical protein